MVRVVPSRRLSPDTAIEISLNAVARRLACDYAPLDVAVEELRSLAGDRVDLLAKAAGLHLGGYLANPATEHPAIPYAAALLVLAGADPEQVASSADTARRNAGGSHYSL
jgi:hypothetical protein